MASLQEFAEQRKSQQPIMGLKEFAERNTGEPKNLFRTIGKELMKPVGVTAKEFRGVGEAIGNLISIASPRVSASQGLKAAAQSLIEAQKGAGRVLIGKEETDFRKEMEDVAKKSGTDLTTFEKTMALGSDLVLDPLNIISPVKIVKKVGEVTRLAEPTAKLIDVIKQAPASKKITSLFTNTTGNKEFDQIVLKFRNLKEFREGELIDDAVQLQKDIKNISKTLGEKKEEVEMLITNGLEKPESLVNVVDKRIANIVGTLQKTYKELLEEAKSVGLSIGEIKDYAPHIRTKESFFNTIKKEMGLGAREFGKSAIEKGRKLKGTIEELTEQGIDIFEKNPAIQLVKKGQVYAKAITSQQFANAVKKFATDDGVEVTHTALKGLKFAPEQAKVIDNYYKSIKPEELNSIFKTFDKVQNWWKAQALVSPSYHIRNAGGNLWNNFIAGVNPAYYAKALHLQKGSLQDIGLIEEMKKLGVINEGWYAKDIGEEVLSKVDRLGNWKEGLNPLAQSNYLFQLNKKIGTGVENNARIAHYLSMKDKGMTAEKAAESVKKYLFDYGDLTDFEKTVLKRVVPFYTWTRKNLPLQISGLVTQPGKYAVPHKMIENWEAGVEQPNEKYMSYYLRENIPVRLRKNKDGNTEYFLLGNWLPYASAIDVLSLPLDTIIQQASPLIKVPIEQWANQSTFWKDSFGKYQELERGGLEHGEFLGQLMRKKNIQLLSNIRILNDMNKWIDKQDPTAVKNTWGVKMMNTFFGKAGTYDVGKSKYFYDQDTDEYISELKKAIKSARKKGYNKKADLMFEELNEIKRTRKGD